MAEQQRRCGIVLLTVVPQRLFGAFVRIAVAAAVGAAVVCANVATLDAVAATARALVLARAERDVVRRTENLERHAAALMDAVARPILIRSARL